LIFQFNNIKLIVEIMTIVLMHFLRFPLTSPSLLRSVFFSASYFVTH